MVRLKADTTYDGAGAVRMSGFSRTGLRCVEGVEQHRRELVHGAN